MNDKPIIEESERVTFKFTEGHVSQRFVGRECVSQEFVAGDNVTWEDVSGIPISPPGSHHYQTFNMVQPGDTEKIRIIQEGLSELKRLQAELRTAYASLIASQELRGKLESQGDSDGG